MNKQKLYTDQSYFCFKAFYPASVVLTSNNLSLPESVKVNPVNQPIYMIRKVHSSILLNGYQPKNRDSVRWIYVNSQTRKTIVHYSPSSMQFNPYYKHRAEFDVFTGSLLLRNLQAADSGIYEVILNPVDTQTLEKGDQLSYVELEVQVHSYPLHHKFLFSTIIFDVTSYQIPFGNHPLVSFDQEQLVSPQIIQNPAHVLNHVELRCIVQIGKANTIWWEKDTKKVFDNSHLRIEFDGSALFIDQMSIMDCGLYTCLVKNNVSLNSNSVFLSADGILFLHEDALVSSVVALVSTLTSFISTGFILFAVEKKQVKKYCLQVNSVVLIYHGLNFVCHLVTFVIFVLDEGFVFGYKIAATIGCIHYFAKTVYIVILFLQSQTIPFPFLTNYYKGTIFLGCEFLVLLIDVLLIYKSKLNMIVCKFSYHALVVKIILSVTIYVSSLGLFILFHTKLSHRKLRSHFQLKAVKRIKESKSEDDAGNDNYFK
ncbi:uncharacterized protein LOC122541562 [Chiloscyllium plagiosum]|uniref:uncharacterized protein LOC122541562 n=1 Tax=Chiloscyllium plagiosum TaxID=36176 RepID=UPI001CB84707|nr:uncharacterized protein LOC122541562 [Chiloscyllium plagiosum]